MSNLINVISSGKSKTRTCRICNHFVAQIHIRSIDSHTIVVYCMNYTCRWMCELGRKSKPSKFQIFLANILELKFRIRLIDSHTIVVFCMTKACQLMGEHGSEPLGIQSRHELRSSKRRPSPQLVATRWASVGVPILCCGME